MTDYRHPWDMVRYGSNVVYWATVSGISTIFSERALGAALPAGFSAEDPSLVVDRSSQVGSTINPDSGLGTGLPLSIQLRDSTAVASYLIDSSRNTQLAADLTATATTATVTSTAAFPGVGRIYIGPETIDYTGTTPTTFTGLTRGVAGLAYRHAKDSAAALVSSGAATDWRGRTVRLYAAVIDPTGYVPTGTLAALSSEVWIGTVREGPYRSEDSTWQLDALSMDRKLANPLAAAITGTVDATTLWHTVQAGDGITVQLNYDSTPTVESFTVVPYTIADTGPTGIFQVTGSELRKAVVAAWNAATTALGAGALMGDLRFQQQKKGWVALMGAGPAAPASGKACTIDLGISGKNKSGNVLLINAVTSIILPWTFLDNPLQPGPDLWAANNPYHQNSVSIVLEGVDPGDVPTTGGFLLGGQVYSYNGASPLSGALRLYGVEPPLPESELAEQDGEDVELIQMTGGNLADIIRRVMQSSGTASLRGAYDTLPADAGYSIASADIDLDSFAAVVGGSLAGVSFDLALSDRSLEDALGGLLGLAERAIVLRGDGAGKQRLALVRTSPTGSSTVATITDADLLVSEQVDPVTVERGSPVATSVEVELANGLVESPDKIVFRRDRGRRQMAGGSTFSATIPLTDVSQAISYVGIWAAGRFSRARPHTMISLRVGPDIAGEPGDLVYLNLRHPSLYDWALGAPGYTGAARVLGRTLALGSYQSVLTVIPAQGAGLSPSAEVKAWAGAAAAPTTIDVERGYYDHFARTAELAGASFGLMHYTPGADVSGQGYTVSAVTDTGTVCRLTVAAFGGAVLSVAGAGSWLTLPPTSTSTDFQAGFAHIDSGGPWV